MAKIKKLDFSVDSDEFPIPEKMGDVADVLAQLKDVLSAKNKEVDNLERIRARLYNVLFEKLPLSGATGISGALAVASIVTDEVPTVQNELGGWEALYDYGYKTKTLHLMLNRALSKKYVLETMAQMKDAKKGAKKIPGVGLFIAKKISLTKPKGKK